MNLRTTESNFKFNKFQTINRPLMWKRISHHKLHQSTLELVTPKKETFLQSVYPIVERIQRNKCGRDNFLVPT